MRGWRHGQFGADSGRSHDNRLARVHPEPTLTAAGHGLLIALTLTAMGQLPKVLLAIKSERMSSRLR
jgi:hypothetical protein